MGLRDAGGTGARGSFRLLATEGPFIGPGIVVHPDYDPGGGVIGMLPGHVWTVPIPLAPKERKIHSARVTTPL